MTRIVTTHADIYFEEFEPRAITMHKDSTNKRVQRTRVATAWGEFVIDHFSNGKSVCTAIATENVGRRSTATPLEIVPKYL